MSRLLNLKSAKTLSDLAILIGYKPKTLAYIAYKIPDDYKYTSFFISKKNGGEREIQAPTEKLKTLQNRISELLYDCIDENAAKKSIKRQLSHGFERGFSITTNAQKHINQRYVFNIDIKDFFPSINFGRVRGYFIKNTTFALDPKVATVIAQIACFKNELPQGSPCSPIISNLISQTLDSHLVQLAKKNKCVYSRYADDITYSSKSKIFPKEIAQERNNIKAVLFKYFLNKAYDHNWYAGPELIAIIERNGFALNQSKTRMQFKDSRQVTTGLIVNKKVNVKSEYYKTVRSQCNELFNKGSYFHKLDVSEDTGETIIENGTLAQLEGALNFIYEIKNPKKSQRPVLKDKHGKPYSKEWKKEHGVNYERADGRNNTPRGISAVYQRFLHFKYLFSFDKPFIICEGKTDVIYLKCALNQLAAQFPGLASTINSETTLKLDFLNNHGRVIEVWNLGRGTSFLAKIIMNYERILSPFRCDGPNFPVIIIVDNDDGPRGGGGVYQKIEKYGQNNVKGLDSFYYVTKNLYVIPLPQVTTGVDIDFEDLFDTQTLSIPHNGKIFKKEVVDKKIEYGKSTFANRVVKPKQKTIDFSGFVPLLQVIQDVILDYDGRKP